MKSRLLIIIGIVIVAVSLSYYVIYDSSTTVFVSCDPRYDQIDDKCVLPKPEQYCKDWCDLQELSSLGCNQPVLDYIYRYTNLFDEKFDGVYYRNFVGLPDGVSEEQFEECADFIREKRISIEPNPVFFEGYPQVNQNDRWCSTTWIVHHDTLINTQLIIEKILQKISEYGEKYDVAERTITIKIIDENTSRISVQGVWDRTFENEEPFLTSFMKTFEFVSVEESRVACA